ncbi:hypothetical protein SAMN04515671_3910 [Nakamurella panacisegetis]|uniref:Uncharacterized protein n=1 Tax=Nakamurella panacisegetis TaxID=1090615 RepID=A0A1H0S503_9ACTN|nr:hypothetical protein [Nakamurella panacisegetis]SDP36853.1 hypothetical protein SAMN04515671_3910 [Nakamurella panacisegetis]
MHNAAADASNIHAQVTAAPGEVVTLPAACGAVLPTSASTTPTTDVDDSNNLARTGVDTVDLILAGFALVVLGLGFRRFGGRSGRSAH